MSLNNAKAYQIVILFLFAIISFNLIPVNIRATSSFTLISLEINGDSIDVDYEGEIEARLRTNLTINATWNVETPPQYHHVRFLLWNNETLLYKSEEFTEEGYHINRFWSVTLDPKDWDLNQSFELGRIIIEYIEYDGEPDMEEYYLRILPEQLNCSLTSKNLHNKTIYRMDYANLFFKISSIQDPSFLYDQFPVIFNIQNANQTVFQEELVTDKGNFSIIINNTILMNLEEYNILIQNYPDNKIENLYCVINLSDIFNRTKIEVIIDSISYYEDQNQEVLAEIQLGFNLIYYEENIGQFPAYYNLSFFNESFETVIEDSGFIYLNEILNLSINTSYIYELESLKYHLFFEGNFFVKPCSLYFNLSEIIFRDDVKIEFINYDELIHENCGDLIFYVSKLATNEPIINHPIIFTIGNINSNEIFYQDNNVTTNNGNVLFSIAQYILDDLERFFIKIESIPTLEYRNGSYFERMDDLFQRHNAEISLQSVDFPIKINANDFFHLNGTLSIENAVEYNYSNLKLNIHFLDEYGTILLEEILDLEFNGYFSLEIPSHLLPTNVKIIFKLNSTYNIKPVVLSIPLIIESNEIENLPLIISLIVLISAFIAISTFLIVKKRTGFIKMSEFKIHIKDT